ncbi:MAG: hypothetical protein GX435_07455, partial [Exilispira sp.]|nr:hypothetical protein [Exilispira sp.]
FSSGNAKEHQSYSYIKVVKDIVKKMIRYKNDTRSVRYLNEGVANLVQYRGKTSDVLDEFEMSLKRSMWYLGAKDIDDIQKRSRAVICSPLTMTESKPRI